MAFDAIEALRAAGNSVDSLAPAQQEILRGLSPAEVATLNSVKARMDEVSDDVEGHLLGFGVF